MTVSSDADFLAFLLVIVAILAFVTFTFAARSERFKPNLRRLSAYSAVSEQINEAIESGRRVHISLAGNSITAEDTATSLAGLNMLRAVSKQAIVGDQPPLATTSDATTLPLMRDIVYNASEQEHGPALYYDNTAARMLALDPLTMAAALTGLIPDEKVVGNILIGSFEREAILITEAGERRNLSQVVASDKLEGQAVAFAATDHALIGEELFVAEAYLSSQPSHIGSLLAQDFLRLIVISSILIGVVLKTLGTLD